MPKCDLRIVFDRPDRTYCGGEPVGGRLLIQAGQDFSCSAVKLEEYWQTHGSGNAARGPRQSLDLPGMDFRAGQSYELPFSFTAPAGPPTYHGSILNVDHYVRAVLDVAWSLDPKCSEDYVLLPGALPWENLEVKAAPASNRGGGSWGALALAIALGVAGVLMIWSCGFILIILGGVILATTLKKMLVEKGVGKVDVRWGPQRAAPGARLPIRLSFTPRRRLNLSGVTLALAGMERCVSGSGTNATTHTHQIHRNVLILSPAMEAPAGQPLTFSGEVALPADAAYSFHATDNDLRWTLELRIDIARWPDWVQERLLAVRPDGTGAEAAGPAGEKDLNEAEDFASQLPPPVAPWPGEDSSTPPPQIEEPAGTEPESEAAGPAADAGPTLAEVVQQLLAASRYGMEREDLVASLAGRTFDCTLQVEAVQRTFGLVPEPYRDGRTVIGALPGIPCKLALQLLPTDNAAATALLPGSLYRARVTLAQWDILYDRLELRGVGSPSAESN